MISGWGPYAERAEVDFSAFDQEGIFLITGPTGGGKTTIFDAISFALYGDVSGKNREKTSVRSDFAKADTDTFVELAFSHKGIHYRIRRAPKYARPKKRGEGYTISNETAELYVEEQEPIASVTEVNRALEQIMGLNYEQFKQIAMIAQGEFLELLVANSRDRVEIFRNLFHTEDYEKLQRYLSIEAKHLLDRIKTLRDRMKEAIASLEVVGNEELEELVEAEEYQYEKIFNQVKQLIENEKKEITILENQIMQKDNLGKQLLLKIKDGEQLNEKIQLFHDIVCALEEFARQKDTIDQWKESLKGADLALKAAGEEEICKNLKERLVQMKNSMIELEITIEDQLPGLQNAKLQQEENQKRMEQLEVLKEQERNLEGIIPLLKELNQAVEVYQNSQTKCTQTKEKEEKLALALEAVSAEMVLLKEEQATYTSVEAQIGQLNLELEKRRQMQETLQIALKQHQLIKSKQEQLIDLQKEYSSALSVWSDKRQQFEEKETIYKNAAVGLVARLLEVGKPCPVCGSIEHPKIAPISHDVPDENQLELLKNDLRKSEEYKNEVYEKTVVQKGLVDSLLEEWETISKSIGIQEVDFTSSLVELNQRVELEKIQNEKLIQRSNQLNQQFIRRQEIDTLLIQLKEKRTTYLSQREVVLSEFQQAKSEYDRLTGVVSQMEERLPKDKKTLSQVLEELSKMKQHKEELTQVMEDIEKRYLALKEQMQKNQTLLVKGKEDIALLVVEVSEVENRFLEKLKSLGFIDEEAYHRAILSEEVYAQRKGQIKEYERQLQTKSEQKLELEKEIDGRESVDLSLLKETLNEADNLRLKIQKEKEQLNTKVQVNQKALISMKEKWKEKEKLEEEYGILKDLDDITKGNNPERIVFEHYVLSVYFEEVIKAANYRLYSMTGGRYELEKVSRVADARTKDSLDLEVLDNYTGKKRSVKTLSGGESFKAALSLALGLSDIVQNNAGGIQIDTLFIDEGFGSLDTESLDQALNTLMMLTEHNRLIGIISHVNELKERIDNQVIIDKGNNGSTLKVKTL